MERILEGQGDNSPNAYNQIYLARQAKGLDWQDIRRWEKMMKHYRGGKLADIGCLDSNITTIARHKDKSAIVIGTDIASLAIKLMQKRNPTNTYIVDDIYNSRLARDYFDYVVMGEVIEHLEDPLVALHNALELVRRGGWLVISTPLNEAIEPGAVDKSRHLWSFNKDMLVNFFKPYGKVKTKVLHSRYFPKYKYCFKQLIVYVKKV